MVDPFLTSGPSGVVFCDVVIELQVMCSDRVDPNDPLADEEEQPLTENLKGNQDVEGTVAKLETDGLSFERKVLASGLSEAKSIVVAPSLDP